MAKNRKVPRLGPGELEILQMLWRERGVTILEAQQALRLPIGYTTVQTRLNRLVKKGVVQKTNTRPARYQAAVSPEEVRNGDLDLLVDRVSNGQVVPLVAQLVNRRKLTQQEIQQIQQLLEAAEQRLPKPKAKE